MELALIRLCQLPKPEGASTVRTEKKRTIEPIVSEEKPTQKSSEQRKSPDKEYISANRNIPEKDSAQEQVYPNAEANANRNESVVQESESKYQQSHVHTPTGDDIQKITENNDQKPVASNIRKPAEAATSLKKRTVSLSGMGVSLSSLSNKETEETPSTGPATQHNGTNLFTEKELIKAWEEYAKNLNEEKLLKNTMSLYLPKMLSSTLFEVEVNTELNKQYLTDHGNTILSFLREKLGNGDITMTIKIAEGNAIKKALTSHEIFEEMVQQNPSLQKLSDEFGLELS